MRPTQDVRRVGGAASQAHERRGAPVERSQTAVIASSPSRSSGCGQPNGESTYDSNKSGLRWGVVRDSARSAACACILVWYGD